MRSLIFILGAAERYPNYQRAVEAAGGAVLFFLRPLEAVRCDGLLLPGGGDLEPWRYGEENTASRGLEPERDAAELALLDQFAALRRPVLGICRGMQAINVWRGGTLIQDLPGHAAVNGQDGFHRVYTGPGFLRRACGGLSTVNSAHHQAAGRLGRGLRAVQWAEDGVVEALEWQDGPVWGVQWHPERMPGTAGAALFSAFLARCRR